MTNDQKLDILFAQYRESCPDSAGDANFMPALWQRIDARRKSELWLFRFANFFAAAAAMVALVTGLLFYQAPGPLPQRAYIEKLTDEISEDYFLESTYSAKYAPVKYSVQEEGPR